MKKVISIITLCTLFISININATPHRMHAITHHWMPLDSSNNHNNYSYQAIENAAMLPEKYVVVPNRSDSTITLLATPSGDVLKKITAADTGFDFEPIYASSLPKLKLIAVSDRMHNQIIFFDNQNFAFLGTAPASAGMFHMWPNPEQDTLFAVADIDRVVDIMTLKRFGQRIIYKRHSLAVGNEATTGKPHDIMVDRTHIYVTMIGVENEEGSKNDLLLKYNRNSLALEGKLTFSFDIHLGLPLDSPYLLVPETTTGKLNYLDKKTLEIVAEVNDVTGAHGIWWNKDASKVYLANFGSQGAMSIYEVRQTVDSANFSAEKRSTHDLVDAKAHNITVDFVNQVMFVTHSGSNVDGQLNRNVSLFSVAGTPRFIKSIESGANPLGILLVDRAL